MQDLRQCRQKRVAPQHCLRDCLTTAGGTYTGQVCCGSAAVHACVCRCLEHLQRPCGNNFRHQFCIKTVSQPAAASVLASERCLMSCCRSNKSPHRLISRFIDNEATGTLHDNLESAAERYPHVRVLSCKVCTAN